MKVKGSQSLVAFYFLSYYDEESINVKKKYLRENISIYGNQLFFTDCYYSSIVFS